MQDIAIVIPAAGASSRMRGRDKLTETVEGVPLLRRMAERAIATHAHVCVTLPDHDHPRAAALAGLPVQLVAVPDSALGMSASIRRGIGLLPPGMRAAIILPADMPDLETEDICSLIKGFRATPQPMLQQATAADGTPGHPVLFPADCFMALQRLTGDRGARAILEANRNRLRHVALPGRRALTDLDTPEAWEEWQAAGFCAQ
jgi:CTP:molybdopterin cytidylyltransferase MocA